jgi:hypothetical protein
VQVEIVRYGRISGSHALSSRLPDGSISESHAALVETEAIVRRVFDHDAPVQIDDRITFSLKVYEPPGGPLPDAGGWIDLESYQQLRFVEMFLNGSPPHMDIAASGSEYEALPALTDVPTVARPSKEDVDAIRRRFEGA